MAKSIKALISRLPAERQELIEALAHQKAKEMIADADSLEVLRKAFGMTQAEVARTLGVQQNAVSQLEKRTDIYISTLQKYVKALGMDLEIALLSKDGRRTPLPNFRPWREVEGPDRVDAAPATSAKEKREPAVSSPPSQDIQNTNRRHRRPPNSRARSDRPIKA